MSGSQATGRGKPAQRPGLSPQQRHALPPFSAIRAFEAIGTCGGVRRAAVALSLDHAAVSRHLRALEQWAGVPLVDRTPGSGGRLTAEGLHFHGRIAKALAEIARASIELTHRGDERSFRLWCTPGIASEWLTKRLGVFAAQYSEVDFELQPTEEAPDLASHEADAHLHYVVDIERRDDPDPALRVVEIARPPILAVASPRFLDRAGPFSNPADLLSTTLLHESSFGQWRRWFDKHGVDAAAITGPKFWHGHLTLAAARQGHGVALANALLVGDDLRAGALVEVGSAQPVYLGSYMFTARRDRWRDRVVLGFRRWLENTIAAEAAQSGDVIAPVTRS